MVSSAWEPCGTFPSRSRAIPYRCRTWLGLGCSAERQARPCSARQQTGWHFFHHVGVGRKARRAMQAVWFQKKPPSMHSAHCRVSPEGQQVPCVWSPLFPNLHFHLSSDTRVSLHAQGKNLPQNNGIAVWQISFPWHILALSI